MLPPIRSTRSDRRQQQQTTPHTTKDAHEAHATMTEGGAETNAAILENWFKADLKPSRKEQREMATRLGM